MSAILGRIELGGGLIDRAQFLACFQKLKPYGPDLSETWIDGANAVGRHLLRIAPAASYERLVGPIDGVVVVADAILDNREELAAELRLSPEQLANASDTELVRLCYLHWAEDCVHRLVGDFAFAAIHPHSQEIFLARDHIGSRPLFWALRDQSVIFATSIEAIVSFSEWRWTIDERIVAEYLLSPSVVTKPFFLDIRAVPSGSSVALRGGRVVTKPWWRPSTRMAAPFKNSADAVAASRTLLERAVADRLNTDARIGAHFSGGIDSTGVAVIGSRALRARGRSLTRAYAWSPAISDQYPADHARDERRLIQNLANSEGIPVQFGVADCTNFMEFTRTPMELQGEADLADEIPVLRAARSDGLRVMISGWGGDEAFSAHGFGYLAHLALKGKLAKFKNFAHRHTRSLKRLEFLLPLLWRQVIHPLLPNPLYQLTNPYRSHVRHGSFISDRLLQQHADLFEKRKASIKFGPNPSENLKTHICAGHITMRMESWAAWSAPHGFQYRYPLTDKRLLEFLFTLPPDQLFLNARPRGLARAVLADCIPPSASKSDIANERLRRDTRHAAWCALAGEVAGGFYDDDCPWLDTKAFREHATRPRSQGEAKNILLFAELFAAARIWALYRRAIRNGWL